VAVVAYFVLQHTTFGCSVYAVGGKGSVIGAVLGVMIIGVVNNGMNILELPPAYHEVVKGAIIWTAVAVDSISRRG